MDGINCNPCHPVLGGNVGFSVSGTGQSRNRRYEGIGIHNLRTVWLICWGFVLGEHHQKVSFGRVHPTEDPQISDGERVLAFCPQ